MSVLHSRHTLTFQEFKAKLSLKEDNTKQKVNECLPRQMNRNNKRKIKSKPDQARTKDKSEVKYFMSTMAFHRRAEKIYFIVLCTQLPKFLTSTYNFLRKLD